MTLAEALAKAQLDRIAPSLALVRNADECAWCAKSLLLLFRARDEHGDVTCADCRSEAAAREARKRRRDRDIRGVVVSLFAERRRT